MYMLESGPPVEQKVYPAVPRVSVVIATKNRPTSLARLLECIKRQTLSELEVIVVDDGSSRETVDTYPSIWSGLDERFELHLHPSGGGPGGSRNTGIRLSRGEFVAFCDDDDIWVRDDHLETAVAALSRYDGDIYLVNMQMSRDGVVSEADWYGKGGQLLKRVPLNQAGTLFDVSATDLGRFLEQRPIHANTLVVRTDLIVRAGLYWDKIHFAEDLNLSFRLADASRRTLFCAEVAAEADVSDHPSAFRRYDADEQILVGFLAVLHAEYRLRTPQLRVSARRIRAYHMTQLSQRLLGEGLGRRALRFAIESLMTHPSPSGARQLGKVLLQMAWPKS